MSRENTLQQPLFRQLAALMAIEARAEQEKLQQQIQQLTPVAAEQTGNSLIQLTIRDEVAGLGGRVLVTLGKRNQQLDLPWTRLRVGSPVQLAEEQVATATPWRGVVSQLRRESIQVALLQWPEPQGDRPTFRLDLAGDEIAHQRELAALATADGKFSEAARLDGEEILRWTSFNGEAMAFPRWVLVNQAVHHATEHRAQIAGALTAHGISAIDLDSIDVWAYFESTLEHK